MTGVGVSPLNRNLVNGCLKRARPEKDIDNVALVRLQPVELDRTLAPTFSRSMFGASLRLLLPLLVSVIALYTNVGPIFYHLLLRALTTLTNGNMNSVLASDRLRESQ